MALNAFNAYTFIISYISETRQQQIRYYYCHLVYSFYRLLPLNVRCRCLNCLPYIHAYYERVNEWTASILPLTVLWLFSLRRKTIHVD